MHRGHIAVQSASASVELKKLFLFSADLYVWPYAPTFQQVSLKKNIKTRTDLAQNPLQREWGNFLFAN